MVSPELKDFVQERFGVPEEVLVILPNGVNRSVFTPPRACSERIQELRRTLGISETNRIATFVCPRNGQVNEIALKWFFNVVTTLRQETNDLRFLIVGAGTNYPVPTDSVIYTGFIDDLNSVLDLSDVCVLPYPRNAICGGARNKALEYFASGKPVISTREGMRGIDAVPGRDYLEANSVEEFAQNVLAVLSEKVLAHRLSVNGVALAERYDWNTIGEKLFEVLASLTSES